MTPANSAPKTEAPGPVPGEATTLEMHDLAAARRVGWAAGEERERTSQQRRRAQ